MPPTEFGIKVKSARARLGMSQSEFAEHLGVPTRTLQHWELTSHPYQPRGLGRRLIEERLDAILHDSGEAHPPHAAKARARRS